MQNITQGVILKLGPHSTEVPKGMKKLFEKLFNEAEFDKAYNFSVLLGEKVRASCRCKTLEVKIIDPKRKSVVVLAKPGDNGTRFKCYLFQPNGFTGTEEEFFNKLKKAELKLNGGSVTEKKVEDKIVDKTDKKTKEDNTIKAAESSSRMKRRMVSKILDEEVIKCILLYIHEASEGKILRPNLKKKIIGLGINCSDIQAIKFLKKEGYIEEEIASRVKVFISLSEKGKNLFDHKPAEIVGQLPVSSGPPSEQSTDQKSDQPSELTALAAKFDQLKKNAAPLEEKVEILKGQLSAAKQELVETVGEISSVRQRIKDILGQ